MKEPSDILLSKVVVGFGLLLVFIAFFNAVFTYGKYLLQ